MKVFQIHDPIVWKFPYIMSLFKQGLSGFSEEIIYTELNRLIKQGIVTLGFDGINPKGFVLIELPSGFEKYPQVVHFYSAGSRAFTRSLASQTLDIVNKRGYNTVLALNGSGRSDDTWKRVFRMKNWNIEAKQMVFEFKVKQ